MNKKNQLILKWKNIYTFDFFLDFEIHNFLNEEFWTTLISGNKMDWGGGKYAYIFI